MTERPEPLKGVRVIDLTQVLAGPYCTYQLALLGAEVIKIERPGGEQTRFSDVIPELSQTGLGLAFCVQNAQKDFIELNLKDQRDLAILHNLIVDADVLVQNFRPGVAERLGIGESSARQCNSSLIYCSISAYGGEGPIGGRPAYDHIVQAMSGIMNTTGTEEMGPVKVGAPYVDYGTGLNAAFAITSALLERNRTGEGQSIDVAMLDTAMILMANNLATTATTGREPPKLGNEAASGSPSSGTFDTAEGLLAIAANTERQFKDLCRALNHEEWIEDPRWASPNKRQKNIASFRERLNESFLKDTAIHWEMILVDVGVPASRVRTIGEVLEEGQPASRELLAEIKVASTSVKIPGIGFKLNGHSLVPQRAPKTVGADNKKWIGE